MHDPHAPVLDILIHPIASDSFYILGLVYSKLRIFGPKSHPHYTSKTTVISMVFKNFCIKVVVSLGRAPLNANFDTKLAFIFLLTLILESCKYALYTLIMPLLLQYPLIQPPNPHFPPSRFTSWKFGFLLPPASNSPFPRQKCTLLGTITILVND